MTIDVEKLKQDLGLTDIKKALDEVAREKAAAKAAEVEAARKAAEEARVQELISKAAGNQKEALEAANATIKALEGKLEQSSTTFAKTVEQLQEQLIAQADQIKQVLAAREGKNGIAVAVSKALMGDQETFEKSVEDVVLLGSIMKKDIFETKLGEAHLKAVNASSSIQVSSESYETIFSQRILRDIQKLLVVGAMFTELPMTSKLLTMMIEPEAGTATWVDSTTYGQTTTTGNEVTVALTEKQFRTYKLAAKAYMTDETEEDAIVALLPIIRRHLVEAHAKAIETAFMNGNGTNQPLGLIGLSAAASADYVSAAKADGTVKVTGKEILKARRNLGLHGLDLSKLALVVSMDAYYDLLEDEEWQDVQQVGAADSVKLQGQVGRIYGLPVVVSSYFPAKAVSTSFGLLVYRDNFVVPRQRDVTVEREREAGRQRDAYYVTQRLNLQALIDNKGVVSLNYAAA